MNVSVYLLSAAVVVVLLYFLAKFAGGSFLKYRGKRVITCPENELPAAVEVNAARAALSAGRGKLDLRLSECSRWPEKANCGQECIQQIKTSPEDCLVRNIFQKWYVERNCAVCGRALGQADWMEHQPTLMNPQRITIELRNIAPESIAAILSSHQPVCWNCHVAETFRRQHPDLVVDRGWKDSHNPAAH